VVETPVLARLAWSAGAAASGLLLLGLAVFGERPQTHVATFQAAGLMKTMPPAEIRSIEIKNAAGLRQFRRDAEGWHELGSNEKIGSKVERRIDEALRLLHNSAPERSLAVKGIEEDRAFGLDPPALQVTVTGSDTLSVAFGATNPLGLARYARVRGQADVLLIPKYVVEAWEEVLASSFR